VRRLCRAERLGRLQTLNHVDDGKLATPPCSLRNEAIVFNSSDGCAPRFTSAHLQGYPNLISPSVILAVLQTLFAALLSLGALGGPSLTHGHGQGLAVREAAARPYTLSGRAIAPNEEADRSDPHQSGGSALPPAELARPAIPTPSRLSAVPVATLGFAERSVRAHPATGPPLV